MDSEISQPRLGPVADVLAHLDSSFLIFPPTIKHPHPVVGHGELGMCAVVVYDGVALLDERTGKWFGPDDIIKPEEMAATAALDLAAAARAPADRVTALVWLPSGLSGQQNVPHEQIVATPNPQIVAKAIEDLMARRLTGSNEPTTPWLGAYAAAAMGPKERPPLHFRRFLAALEYSLGQAIGDEVIICYDHELTVSDLVDPQFLLPALAIAASEDWHLVAGKKPRGSGFSVNLHPDPSTLLGYRVTEIKPAIPFTALAPIVATARRCKDDGMGYVLDDIIRQFTRWLKKNGRDASILEDVETRIATSG